MSVPGIGVAQMQPVGLLQAFQQQQQNAAVTKGQQLSNQTAQTNLQTLDQMNKAKLQGLSLLNQQSEAQLPYVGPQASANVKRTQAETGLTNANTGLINTRNNYLPLTSNISLLTALARQASGQSQADRTTLAFYQTPEGQNILRNNPKDQKAFSDIMERQRSQAAGGILSGLNNADSQQTTLGSTLQNNSSMPNALPMSGSTAGITSGQQISPTGIQRLGQILNSGGGFTGTIPAVTAAPQDNTSSIAEAANNSYQTKNFTPAQRLQIQRANSADALLQQVAPLMPDIVKFAGIAGKAKQSASKAAQALNISADDPSYQNFQIAKEYILPMAAGEIVNAMGYHMTDSQKAEANHLTNPDWIDKNPQQALREYNALVSGLQAVEGQIGKSPSQAVQQLNENVQHPPLASALSSTVRVQSPDGQIGTIPRANIAAALKKKYRVLG